eukprot:gene25327-30585_t
MKYLVVLALVLLGGEECYSFRPSILVKRNAVVSRHSSTLIDSFTESSSLLSSTEFPQLAAPKRTPIGSVPDFVLETDSTEVTFSQTALVSTHFLLFLCNLAVAISHVSFWNIASSFWALISFGLSVVIGDFATGVFHWSVDNYGSINTPVVGSICAAFQGHHNTPWTITFRPFVNNVFKIAKSTIPAYLVCLGVGVGIGINAFVHLFFTFFINWWLISQELHKYAHMKSPPAWIQTLQSLGVVLTRKEHGSHHTSPFETNYCILTGTCNSVLDKKEFFRYLEKIVFKLTGNKPLSWNDQKVMDTAMAKFSAWN